jgi:hypothetical protein
MKLQEAELIDWSRAAIDSSHVRAFGGRKDWPEPRRPRATRFQAPPDRLRARHAACSLAHWRQPQRHHAADSARRRDPASARTARPAASPPAEPVRRPRLPVARRTQRTAPPSHPGEDRVGEERARFRTGNEALGRRAHDRLAPPVSGGCASAMSAATTSMKAFLAIGLQPDLPQTPPAGEIILLGALSGRRSRRHSAYRRLNRAAVS